ncbi:GTP-binding protein ypt2 [Acropora cervicornis]|uniref:GTP-binding protein ypt2 n=1 Tax=Acropora cervicornis TaxID=6130 RepID=A0AAD9V334_ACRCE|nr:GTP-binding protein ypt2 [Acropora cervicornis]
MTSNSKDYDISYKVLVIGESAVGKTSLIKSYSKPDETFTPSLMPTYGIDFVNIITMVDGVSVRMQIWDTAGQERFRTLTSMHFRGTKGILLVYDITNAHSFDQLNYWLKAMKKHSLMLEEVILVANKCDLDEHKWEVEMHRGREAFQELAKNMKYANNADLVRGDDDTDFVYVDDITRPSYNFPQTKRNTSNCCNVK